MHDTWNAYRRHLLGAMGLLPLVVGCGEEDGAAALPDGALPPPLALTQPGDLYVGQAIPFRVSGATPGATVYLAAGRQQGPGPCPGAIGVCMDIRAPYLIGSATANGQGQAQISATLPHTLPDGLSLVFQAAQAGAASPVLADVTVTPPRSCADVPFLDANNYWSETEVIACAPLPPGGVCPAAGNLTYQQEAWLFEENTGQDPLWVGFELDATCNETSIEDACCFFGYVNPGAIIGRPFGVDGCERLADVADGEGWASPIALPVLTLSRAARRRVAEAWIQHARGEHASVPAFARFVLHLAHLGAPAALLAEATRAQADEIAHAQDAFAVASALHGAPVAAGRFDISGAVGGESVEDIVRAAVREGCVGETIAAAQARRAAEGCTVPQVAAILTGIADDEQRHAALAWRFVRWVVAERPELVDVVREELLRGPTLAAAVKEPYADVLRTWGQLPAADMNDVAREVYAAVILPCAGELLAAA